MLEGKYRTSRVEMALLLCISFVFVFQQLLKNAFTSVQYHVFCRNRFSMTEGANTICGHDVYFDITESNRIGFAPSDCDYYGFVNSDLNNTIT